LTPSAIAGGIEQKTAKSGEIPALSRNGCVANESLANESGRLICMR